MVQIGMSIYSHCKLLQDKRIANPWFTKYGFKIYCDMYKLFQSGWLTKTGCALSSYLGHRVLFPVWQITEV